MKGVDSQRARRPGALAAPLAVALLAAAPVHAGGLEGDVASPRAVGRAGASVVSGDSGAALVLNPAGMARREERRAVVAIGVHDREATIAVAGAAGAPTITDRSSPRVAPVLAVHGALGPVVLGLAYLEEADFARRLPEPTFGQPADDVARLFPHRYGGSRAHYRRRTLALGAAARANDWLGVGVSLTASRVSAGERRAVWAGFAGRDALGSPERDLELALSGDDAFVPGVAAGVLIAPYTVPVELALSGQLTAPAKLGGEGALRATRGAAYPSASTPSAAAELELPSPLVVRAGLRYLGELVVAELGADAYLFPGDDRPEWQLDRLEVTDQTGAIGTLTEVPALLHRRPHLAARAAVDVQVVDGFLWLTAGYAWRGAASSAEARAPAHADLGGHTLAIGLEAIHEGATLSLGYARTLAPASAIGADDTEVSIVNPFDAGSGPAGAARYEGGADQLGLSLELAW